MGLRVLLDVSALLLEPFSREGAGGLPGLSLVVQGSFWGVSSEWISPVRILDWLGGSGSLGYFEVKGRVLTVMRLTSRLSLFRENWALSTRSLSLLVSKLLEGICGCWILEITIVSCKKKCEKSFHNNYIKFCLFFLRPVKFPCCELAGLHSKATIYMFICIKQKTHSWNNFL